MNQLEQEHSPRQRPPPPPPPRQCWLRRRSMILVLDSPRDLLASLARLAPQHFPPIVVVPCAVPVATLPAEYVALDTRHLLDDDQTMALQKRSPIDERVLADAVCVWKCRRRRGARPFRSQLQLVSEATNRADLEFHLSGLASDDESATRRRDDSCDGDDAALRRLVAATNDVRVLRFQHATSRIPVFYVTLAHSTTRNDVFLSQFPGSIGGGGGDNCQVVRVDAVDGRDAVQVTSRMSELSVGRRARLSQVELACTLSHLVAIQRASREAGLEYAIVCEDDADFRLYARWKWTLREIIDEAPDDVDVISLYNRRNTDAQSLLMWERSVCFTRNLHKGGAVAYIVTRKGMNKFAAADPGGCGLLQLHVADTHLFGPGVTCVGVGFTLATRNDRKGNDSTLYM
jgi:hypothetical protein